MKGLRILACIALTLCAWGCRGDGLTESKEVSSAPVPSVTPTSPASPAPVLTTNAPQGALGGDAVVCQLGVLLAEQRLEMRSAVAGVVQSLDVDLGEAVHQGQVLARLDAAPLNHRQTIAKAQLRSAEAELERRKTERRHHHQEVRRNQELGDLISSQAKDEAEFAAANAEQSEAIALAEVERLRALIDQLHDEVDQLTLRAPFDGRVAKIARRQFDRVVQGEPIVSLLAEGEQRVRFAVSPGQELQIGNTLWVETEHGAHRARLDRFSPLLDEASQMLLAEATLATEVAAGFHGAQVHVRLGEDDRACQALDVGMGRDAEDRLYLPGVHESS